MNLFYDYLYIKALQENIRFSDMLERYVGFTDIEFNPNKSINCQARAAARFLGLKSAGVLNDVINDIELFKKIFK